LPDGGIVIDNPGLREIQMWAEESTLDKTFTDIDAFALNCKFGDCAHTNEPECAIKGAIEKGELDQKRFDSYLKLQKEIRNLVTRKQKVKALNEKIVTEKRISKAIKQIKKHKNKYEF
ncbi:MAG: ribosome small subunit-dependent GTPase, partial [Elusimicrobia bacterium]|nr:ribosome small subunit-dependent GTPase [Elusimicrobiota bacterium]